MFVSQCLIEHNRTCDVLNFSMLVEKRFKCHVFDFACKILGVMNLHISNFKPQSGSIYPTCSLIKVEILPWAFIEPNVDFN